MDIRKMLFALIPALIVTAPAFAHSKYSDEHELVKAPLVRELS